MFVEACKSPLVPVTTSPTVPVTAGSVAVIVTCREADAPLTEIVIELGLTVMPCGKLPIATATDPAKPLVGCTEITTELVPPEIIDSVAGLAEIVNPGFGWPGDAMPPLPQDQTVRVSAPSRR